MVAIYLKNQCLYYVQYCSYLLLSFYKLQTTAILKCRQTKVYLHLLWKSIGTMSCLTQKEKFSKSIFMDENFVFHDDGQLSTVEDIHISRCVSFFYLPFISFLNKWGIIFHILSLWCSNDDFLLQVKWLAGRCTCPVQFPIIKVGEGKYKIGDSQTLVFVRVRIINYYFCVGILDFFLSFHSRNYIDVQFRCKIYMHETKLRQSDLDKFGIFSKYLKIFQISLL